MLRIFVAFILFITVQSYSDWSYPGCANVTRDHFELDPIKVYNVLAPQDQFEPLKMTFDVNARGETIIYWVERLGKVKRINATTKGEYEVIGELDPDIADITAKSDEDGLTGIAMSPFHANKIFLFYSKGANFLVSRFDLTNGKIDMNSEKIVLEIPSRRSKWHTGGGMSFDEYGDLWIAVGDNCLNEAGPSNTADLRGGVLRIHPEQDGTYSIPPDNYWEFGAGYFDGIGDPSTATEYRDPNKVRREIYAKGGRNPYGLGIDPVRRWASYGNCGPDHTSGAEQDSPEKYTEESHLFVKPGFHGWPYWSGESDATPRATYNAGPFWDEMDPLNVLNKNPDIQGVDKLTPHEPATHAYPHACAVSSFIARYKPRSTASYKLPPHFDHFWFPSDFNQRKTWAIQMDGNGTQAVDKQEIWTTANLNGTYWGRSLDMQQGPDGAVYVVGYSCGDWRTANSCTGIWRVNYTGPDCQPAAGYREEIAGCMDPLDVAYDSTATHNSPLKCIIPTNTFSVGDKFNSNTNFISYENFNVSVVLPGEYKVTVSDIKGKALYSFEGKGESSYQIPKVSKGIHIISLYSAKLNRAVSKNVYIY